MLRVLDLFSGIGGFSLGLERTGGFETVAFCEIEPFCRKVLAKHWPNVRQYHDVRTLTADALRRDGVAVDVICGGFPCQDISLAGKGAGIEGERSGLWSEYARLIGELRPAYVIVENVAALLHRGLDRVLGDLAALGYDAEWHCIPASAIGAPHRRDRLWIVAYPKGDLRRASRDEIADASDRSGTDVADTADIRSDGQDVHRRENSGRFGDEGEIQPGGNGRSETSADTDSAGRIEQRRTLPIPEELLAAQRSDWWRFEPAVGRVAHGVPSRVDRLSSLGNAVVPQIPELIGRAIIAAAEDRHPSKPQPDPTAASR